MTCSVGAARAFIALASLGLLGCGGVSPRPEEIEATEPEVVTLDAEARAALDAETTRALAALNAGQPDEALVAAQAALALDPRSGRALAVRATCRRLEAQRQNPPELASWRLAEGELRLASRLAPRDPEVALLHAQLLQAEGHLSAAVAELERALESSPDHLGCLSLVASLQYELGDERAALPRLERLVEAVPEDHSAHYKLGRAHLALAETLRRERGEPTEVDRHFGEAALHFARARALTPEDADTYSGEAYARLSAIAAEPSEDEAEAAQAELAEVEVLYGTAARLAPGSPVHWFNQAHVLERLGRDDAAAAAYRRALEADPEYLPALLNLAALTDRQGDAEEAASLARRALALTSSSSERRRLEEFLRDR